VTTWGVLTTRVVSFKLEPAITDRRTPGSRALSPGTLHVQSESLLASTPHALSHPILSLSLQTRRTVSSAFRRSASTTHQLSQGIYPLKVRVPRFCSWVSTEYAHSNLTRRAPFLYTTPLPHRIPPHSTHAPRRSIRSVPLRSRLAHRPARSRALTDCSMAWNATWARFRADAAHVAG